MTSCLSWSCSRASFRHSQVRWLDLEAAVSLYGTDNSIARGPDTLALSDDELQEQLTVAQREAMEAKAEYEIRNRITSNVLDMDPVLKAVHGGERTGYAEK